LEGGERRAFLIQQVSAYILINVISQALVTFLGETNAAAISTSTLEFRHHSNDEIPEILSSIHSRCPNITRVYTLSERSVRGLPLYVVEFSTTPGYHQICECSVLFYFL
jgi:hypothetical protein